MNQNGPSRGAVEVPSFLFQLDPMSGVPIYRQLIDQVQTAIAAGALTAGMQLPTVRQVAVDLAINPNTVVRAYREMEIRGLLDTQQGTGTFITDRKIELPGDERERKLRQLVRELVSRAGGAGFMLHEVMQALSEISTEEESTQQ